MAKNRSGISPLTSSLEGKTIALPFLGSNDSFHLNGVGPGFRTTFRTTVRAKTDYQSRSYKALSGVLFEQVLEQGAVLAKRLAIEGAGTTFTLRLAWIVEESPCVGQGIDIGREGYGYYGRCLAVGNLFTFKQRDMFSNIAV